MNRPPVVIVSPALAAANNGNWHTASRWQEFLSAAAMVEVHLQWRGEPAHALIALHARRSADSIARFRDAHPDRPIALVLTGTDIYRDIETDEAAQHSLKCASHLVVLQDEALHRLKGADHAKARVIVQSAEELVLPAPSKGRFDFVAVGHLREEKDPVTLMRAARRLPADGPIRIIHVGAALDVALGDEAQQTMRECANYRWLGELDPAAARHSIARSSALIHMSRMEGGANVVIEAVRSRVPVLASRIDGNVGLLGRDYDGYFAVGDDEELAQMMERFCRDPKFAQRLRSQCASRESRFAPIAEAAAVQGLLADMLDSAARPR